MYSQRQPLKTRQFDLTYLHIAIDGLLVTPIAAGMDSKFIYSVTDLGVGNYKITFKDKARRALLVVGQVVYSAGIQLRVTATDTNSVTVLCSKSGTGALALLAVQDITYTARELGVAGNAITIRYTNTVVAGAEACTVVGTAITIAIQTGVSTATQVLAAFNASAAAKALVTAAITGTAGTAQVTAAVAPLASGVAPTPLDASFGLAIAYHDNSTLY